jgi:predicted amidohydrolase YtcJ
MGRGFFQSVNLLDGQRASRPHMPVVVEGERIVAVAQEQEVPTPSSADEVYDLLRRSLMPGMALSHCHLAYTNICAMSDVDLIQGPRIFACCRDIVATGDSIACHPSWWKNGLARHCAKRASQHGRWTLPPIA